MPLPFRRKKPEGENQPLSQDPTIPEQRKFALHGTYVDMEAISCGGEEVKFSCRLLYDARDPIAATIKFDGVEWVMALDLLAKGRFEPTGFEGADVQMRPCLREDIAYVEVKLTSDKGSGSFEIPSEKVGEFMDKVGKIQQENNVATDERVSALAAAALDSFDFTKR